MAKINCRSEERRKQIERAIKMADRVVHIAKTYTKTEFKDTHPSIYRLIGCYWREELGLLKDADRRWCDKFYNKQISPNGRGTWRDAAVHYMEILFGKLCTIHDQSEAAFKAKKPKVAMMLDFAVCVDLEIIGLLTPAHEQELTGQNINWRELGLVWAGYNDRCTRPCPKGTSESQIVHITMPAGTAPHILPITIRNK